MGSRCCEILFSLYQNNIFAIGVAMRPPNGSRRPFEFEALEHRFLMAGDLRTAMPGEG
jgi:hypothetical protein